MEQKKRTLLGEESEEIARQVLQIRYWQHLLNEALKRREFNIPIHMAFGHEAIAVAVNRAMAAEDQLVLTHRNVEYNLARVGSLRPVWDEFKCRSTGLAGGKLGSMNLANPEYSVVYSSSVLGNNLSVACGLALANRVVQKAGVVFVLTGDGAVEEGTFWEGLVFAKSHELRVLVIIENNNMSMSSTIEERRTDIDIGLVSESMKIPFAMLRGNDVYAYLDELRSVRRLVLAQPGPACVEVVLKALSQHAGPTPGWPTDPKNISLERGLIVEHTAEDPVFVLEQRLGTEAFERLVGGVLAGERVE